jgi:flagellar biogenesis protein FliO
MKKTTVIPILLLVLALPMLAAQAEGSAGLENVGLNTLDTSDTLKMLVKSTLMIIVLGVVAVYVARRVMPKVGAAMGKELKVVESINLGPRKQVYVLKVGTKRLLVGAASESITYLADVTEATREPGKTQTEGAKSE